MVEDGNLSAPGAFEFRRRIITSVEDDLLHGTQWMILMDLIFMTCPEE